MKANLSLTLRLFFILEIYYDIETLEDRFDGGSGQLQYD